MPALRHPRCFAKVEFPMFFTQTSLLLSPRLSELPFDFAELTQASRIAAETLFYAPASKATRSMWCSFSLHVAWHSRRRMEVSCYLVGLAAGCFKLPSPLWDNIP